MTLRSEIAKFTADVPKDWAPTFDNRGGSYNFSGFPRVCRNCGVALAHGSPLAHQSATRCLEPKGLPAANVGKGHSGKWMLMDPWGTVWAFGFDSRLEAARFAYALVLKGGNVPMDWLKATA